MLMRFRMVRADAAPATILADVTTGTTAADLIEAIIARGVWGPTAKGASPRLVTHGRLVPPTALVGHPPLLDAAYLEWIDSVEDRPVNRPPTPGLLQLHVLRGPDAGLVADVAAGEHVLGRGRTTPLALTDPALSRDHALVRVSPTGITLVDLSSTNGTTMADGAGAPTPRPLAVGDEFTCGNTVFSLRSTLGMPAATRPDGRGHVLVTPPPARPAKPAAPPVRIPSEPTPTPPPRLSILGAALPLAFGVVLAIVLRSPTMVAFGLMGPAISIGTWWSERRAARRSDARARDDFSRTLADALTQVRSELVEEAAARLADDPGPSTMASWARGPLSSLWDRTASSPAEVRIGMGVVAARTQRSDGVALTVMAPVLLDLTESGTTALIGPPEATMALARAILATAMTRFDPDDLAVLVPPQRTQHSRQAWSWLRWAPHCRCADEDETHPSARLNLRVVEGPAPAIAGHTLALVRDEADLPSDCRRRIFLPTDGTSSARDMRADGSIIDFHPDGMSHTAAAQLVDALAPLRSPACRDVSGGLPRQVSLQSLVGPLDALAAQWRRQPRSTRVALGTATSDGTPWCLDLASDGPHCLVAGTTGSGKSELLITLVATLAAANRPDELCFVLVDYKGGAAFGACRDLPHVVGLVTDLDPAGAARAITSLSAELTRREALLAARGASDLAAYQRVCRPGDPTIPRLVILIDEFRTLADEFPLLIDGLVRIAAQGRSLGVHLVVATQRPGGAITADMRANLGLRIALRVRDAVDSLDVIDSPAAASLPADTPGRAIVTTAAHGLVTLQTGYSTAPLASSAAPVTIVSVDGVALTPVPSSGQACPTVLETLVEASRRAVVELGIATPPSPWLAPLPALLLPADLPPPTGTRTVCLGVVDDPQAQAQYGWEWGPTLGSLAIVGGPRTGRSSALRAIATSLAARFEPSELHLYAVHTGALADLAHLPHCGAAVTPSDVGRIERLVRVLGESADTPRVLIVDDVEQVLDTVGAGHPHVRDGLTALMRHSPAGLTVVAAGGRSLITGATAPGFVRRLALLPADPVDLTLIGVRPGAVSATVPPGRAIDPTSGLSVQLVLRDTVPAPLASPAPQPASAVTVPAIPVRFGMPQSSPPGRLDIATDGHGPVGFELAQGRRQVAVVGESGSGRSTALAALAAALRRHGREVSVLEGRRLNTCTAAAAAAELERFVAHRKAHPHLAVLVDDAARLVGTPWDDVLAEVARLVDEDDGFLALAVTPAEVARSPRGIVATVLQAETGLLLGHLDRGAERLLGCRGPLVTEAIPGRGYLVHQGRATAVQVALADPGAGVS